jgi:acyl-CoA thioesterase II
MQIERYPYRASAWWEGRVVAQSDSCLCAETPGEQPVLYFPLEDIDLDAGLSDHVRPADPASELAGHAAFDQDRVRIEVTDEAEGDAAEDVTVKRFPTWGDAAHLVDVMDVRPAEDGLTFFGIARGDERRPVVEGSQMLGQAIVAASRRAPGRRVMSASMIMVRAADAHQPLQFELDELSAGRTFAALTVQVLQGGRVCAAGTVLLDTPSADVVRHAATAPDVPGPYECPPYDMGVTGRDIRVVDGAYSNDPDEPYGPPTLDAWVRFRNVPDDPALHAGLLAQFTGHMSIAAALRPHEGVSQDQAHHTLSMAINSISLSLYGPVKVDDWLLYHHHSTFAGGGTTHAENRVYDLDGALVASFSVDAMVRPLPSGAKGPMDARTAL